MSDTAWLYDTGYEPAYGHTGYHPVSVLLNGTETGSSFARIASKVMGWRSGCDCGAYRARNPRTPGIAVVDGDRGNYARAVVRVEERAVARRRRTRADCSARRKK